MAEIRNTAKLDSKPFTSELGKLQSNVEGFAKKAAGMMAQAFAVGAVINFAKGALQAADEIDNLSNQLQLGIESVQSMSVLMKEAGMSAGELQSTMSSLQRKMAEAASGNKLAQREFAALGISMAELSQMTPEQAIERVTRAMAENRTDANAVAAAHDILGARSIKLQEVLLNLGSKGFAQLNEDMLKSGQIMSVDTVKSMDKMDENLQRVLTRSGNKTKTFFAETIIGAQALKAGLDSLANPLVTMQEAMDTVRYEARGITIEGSRVGQTPEEQAAAQAEQEAVEQAARLATIAEEEVKMKEAGLKLQERIAKIQFDAMSAENRERKLQMDLRNETASLADAEGLAAIEAQNRILDLQEQIAKVQEEINKGREESAKLEAQAAKEQADLQEKRLNQFIEYANELREIQEQTATSGFGSGASLERIGGFTGSGGDGGLVSMMEREIRIQEQIRELNRRQVEILERNPPLTVNEG